MMFFDAETDLKPIIIIIIYYYVVLNLLYFRYLSRRLVFSLPRLILGHYSIVLTILENIRMAVNICLQSGI